MRQLPVFIAAICVIASMFVSCSPQKQETNNSDAKLDILVCYFSATGTTEKAAQRIADITGGKFK